MNLGLRTKLLTTFFMVAAVTLVVGIIGMFQHGTDGQHDADILPE